MMKIKSFFAGILLLIIVFIMVVLTTLVYRAHERSSIKTYIFQTGNSAYQRVGPLQDINNISPNDLRNKLIKKYISEYFKIIPGDSNVTNRPILRQLSSTAAFKQWETNEAKQIAEMSSKKMFRIAKVSDAGIEPVHGSENVNYKTSNTAERFYYAIHYDTYTWKESNNMSTEPEHEQDVIYIEARFKPGIRPDINVREYLEQGKNPVGLFMLEITYIGSKDMQ